MIVTAKTKRKPRRARRRIARKPCLSNPGRRLKAALREVLADVKGQRTLPVVAAVLAVRRARA